MSQLKTTSLSHKDNNTGTPNITMYPDGTTSLPGTMLGGFRNLLINGDFRIWQRGTSFVAGANQQYTVDRWSMTSAATEVQQASTPTLNTGSYELILKGGATGDVGIIQGVELPTAGYAGPFQSGTTWTLSFYSNDANNTVTVGFNTSATGSGAANVITRESVTSLGNNRYSVSFTIGSEIRATDICLFVRIEKNTTDNVRFGNIQLEPGPVATPFEQRPIGTELALCQRYYWNFTNSVNGDVMYFTQYNNSGKLVNIQHPVQMRTTPTVVPVVNAGQAIYNSTGSEKNWIVVITTPSSDPAGYYLAEWTADAEL